MPDFRNRGIVMNKDEFLTLYENASDEVKMLIARLLEEPQQQP